jgi:hypothetical protein
MLATLSLRRPQQLSGSSYPILLKSRIDLRHTSQDISTWAKLMPDDKVICEDPVTYVRLAHMSLAVKGQMIVLRSIMRGIVQKLSRCV